jgi:hypothetical protein
VKYLLILGNGFSMDLLKHIGKLEDYPLGNILSFGDRLPWPENGSNAFISFRNTPNLWLLGVRSNNPPERNNQIIENIITCANAFHMKKPTERVSPNNVKGDLYIKAYKELVSFLKYLFVKIDDEITITAEQLEGWHWTKVLRSLNENRNIKEINIITFNYDLWMERVLDTLGITYKTTVIENGKNGKFVITKPHGSISFMHNSNMDVSAFNINLQPEMDILEGNAEDFTWDMSNLSRYTSVTPLIPPAGDSERFATTWASQLREQAKAISESIDENDKVVLCGLSYWHVDRKEIDEILLHLNDQCELAYINPNPPETLDAVLTSLFSNYEHYINIERYAGGLHA